jgi:hypothetical protein
MFDRQNSWQKLEESLQTHRRENIVAAERFLTGSRMHARQVVAVSLAAAPLRFANEISQ